MSDQPEAPWFSEPPEATLKWGEDKYDSELGQLWFWGPGSKSGLCMINVHPTKTYNDVERKRNVWQISGVNEAGFVTVQPSVHFIGYFHSPNPVQFKIVERLPNLD